MRNDDIELSKNSTVVTERLNPDEATNSKDLAKIFSPEATKIPVVNNVENAVAFVKGQKSKEETVYLYEDKPSEKMQEDAKQGKESIWQAMSRLDDTEGEEGVKTVKVRGTDEEEEYCGKRCLKRKNIKVRKYTNDIKKDQITFCKAERTGNRWLEEGCIFPDSLCGSRSFPRTESKCLFHCKCRKSKQF